MDNEMKKEIEDTNDVLNEMDDLLSWYDRERDLNAKYMSYAEDWANKRVEELTQELVQEKAQDMAKQEIENNKLELAKILKDNGVDLDIISKSTDLTLETIEKL